MVAFFVCRDVIYSRCTEFDFQHDASFPETACAVPLGRQRAEYVFKGRGSMDSNRRGDVAPKNGVVIKAFLLPYNGM